MSDLREQIDALSQITTDLDGYLERRAAELAQPLIDMAKDEAARRIREAESETTRQTDLVTELRRQLAPADRYSQRVKDAEATAHAAREEMLRLSERLRLRKERAEQERDDLLTKWGILAERTLVASALLDEMEPDVEAEIAPRRNELLRKVLAGEAGRDDLLATLVPKLAEAERQRASSTEAAIDRVRALCAELMTIDPADLTRAQRRQLPASVCRAVLAALAHPAAQPEEGCSACAVPLAVCREQGGRCCDACQHHQDGAKP